MKNTQYKFPAAILLVLLPLFSCGATRNVQKKESGAAKTARSLSFTEGAQNLKEIYFAGGCFWGVQEYFSRIPGVVSVTAGYANGTTERPTYEDVTRRGTGHAETVRVQYIPEKVSLQTLTIQFFKIIDPISVNRQGNDRGVQYRSGVYYTDTADRKVLEDEFSAVQLTYDEPLATELKPLEQFYPAEEYHQDYLKKNPGGYCHINFDSLKDLPESEKGSKYTKPSAEEIRKKLTPEQFAVTQLGGTERAFTGEYWNSNEKGLYVDVVTGEPLFSSSDKFDSECGWPSFSKPIAEEAVTERTDASHGMIRTEIRSSYGDSHLGHVFDDGPQETGGLRYCINSAALRFIPYDKLEEEGYGEYR